MRPVKNIETVFPVWKIEQDCILDKQGCFTVAFLVSLPEIFTLSDNDYESLHHAWVRAIKILPVHTILHKQDWFLETKYKAEYTTDAIEKSFLSHASERHFNERPYLEHECYLYLTKKPDNRETGFFSSALFKSSLVPPETLDTNVITGFLDKVGQCIKILTDSGYLSFQRLTAEDLCSTKEKVGLLERYCYLLGQQDPRIIADIQFGGSGQLMIGNKACQLFTLSDVQDLPAVCGPRITYDKYSTDKTKFAIGFAAPLGLLLPVNHIYNQYISLEDERTTLKQLESKRLKLQSLSAYSRENAISRDATNDFLNEAISDGRLPVKAHYNVLTFGDANETRNLVSAAMAGLDAHTKQETESAAQLFWAGIPGNAADIPSPETFDTFVEQASCFLNMETNYQSSISAIGLRLGDRISGLPIQVDLSDEPIRKGICTNRNKFILGPSGSGKSFFTNHLMRSYIEQGAHGVIVDVGHSYRGLCELLGGYYFTYTEKEPIRFNPFYFEGELDTEKKESIKTLLLALWKKDDQSFTRSEYVALSNALQSYYEAKPAFPCFNSFYDFLQNEFVATLKKEEVKEKDFDVSNLLYVLRPYYKGGEFDYLLNATENLDLLEQHLIVFELDNIKDHPILFPVVTLIIMEVFISKMRKLKGIRKIILIEEAWKAIARQGMAEYIKYLFKTVRKFFGEAIVVTQEVDDIISSPVIKDAIINNSDCKILLDQGKYVNKFGQVQELLGLTDKEKTLILSMNKANDPALKYKEVFISLGGTHAKVYRTEVSLEEYLAYTTEEKEKEQVTVYAKKYGSLKSGIKHLAAQLRQL
jgi:conjugation system TraG family ATPase